jgi:hypothetical protein
MTKLVNPIPTFGDGRGGLLDAGYIWIGQAGTDPEVGANQLAIYWDKALTVPAPQPLRTLSGNIVQGMNLGLVYFAEANFSLTIGTLTATSSPTSRMRSTLAARPISRSTAI